MPWGLFLPSGAAALTASSFATFDYSHRYRISDFQQEQGAFASYNKVQTPFQAKVGFLVGGPEDERAVFFQQAELVCASLNLVTIITPEIPYMNANPMGVTYRRTARNGVTLIMVEIDLEEVRIISATALSSTQTASPNGASPQNNGTAQPSTVTPAPGGGLNSDISDEKTASGGGGVSGGGSGSGGGEISGKTGTGSGEVPPTTNVSPPQSPTLSEAIVTGNQFNPGG